MSDFFEGGLPDPLGLKEKERKILGEDLTDPLHFFEPPPTVPEAAPKVPVLEELPAAVKTPALMPTQNSQEVRAAKRRSIATQAARSGRLSTILSNDDGLGG